MDNQDYIGIEAGMAKLDALEATDASQPATTTESVTPEQHAAQPDESMDQAQLNQLTDTPAAPEPEGVTPDVTGAAKTDATVETQAKNEERKFANNQARRDTSWKALNAEKETFTKERQSFETERNAWKAEREAVEADNAVTPEKYEGYAAQMRARADHLNAEADRLDAAGKFDEAEAKREDARDAETDIRKANKAAEELRKNPPANVVQRNERMQVEKKEWTLKAAQDFPDLAKDGSEFQKAVAANLSEIQAYAPGILRDPKSIYLVTRMTAMETAAAGVPELKTKLSQMEARVKEFESLTSPGAVGQPSNVSGEIPFEQKTSAEQMEELRRMAHGTLLR